MSKAEDVLIVNSLILKVRDGDQRAFVDLLNKYKPLIESLVSKFENDELARSLKEDLLQEATLVFYNAILTYDEKQSDVEFGLYARICISNALVSQIRVINKRRVEQLVETEDAVLYGNDHIQSPADDIVGRESLDALYSIIRKNLSDYEYFIWHNFMKGKTSKEISLLVGKSAKSVNNAIYRIRQKLRGLLK